MRTYKFLSFLLIAGLLLPALFGCVGGGEPAATDPETTETEEPTEAPTEAATQPPAPALKTYSVSENLQYIKQLGRCAVVDGGIAADWSASGIEFEFQGSGDLKFRATKTGSGSAVLLTATVDGKDYPVSVGSTGLRTYHIISNLKEGVHHVRIRRNTMVENGAVGTMLQFNAIQMSGTFLEKPADNTYKVAFLGDSITCGVGISDNGLATYAVSFCEREQTDYDICAISGIGVYRSTAKHKNTQNTMTKYYPYYNYYRSDSLLYTPDRRADLVVVNLNTNDEGNGRTDDEKDAYQQTLKTLLSEIREIHGNDVNIVWIVGMMISPTATVNQWLGEVFDELGGESAGLYRLVVETNNAGASSHPNSASHNNVSSALSEYIREKGLLAI